MRLVMIQNKCSRAENFEFFDFKGAQGSGKRRNERVVPFVAAGPGGTRSPESKWPKETGLKVRRDGQEDIEMSQWKNKERNQRVRDILSVMDKSIDRARAKREENRSPQMSGSGLKGIGARSAKEQGEPRLPSSMFDRSGPILKARQKTVDSD